MSRKFRRAAAKKTANEPSPNLPSLLQRAYQHQQVRQFAQAVALYQSVLHYYKNQPDALYGLAYCYDQTGEYRKAAALYAQLLELHPAHHGARLNLGNMQNRLGEKEAARTTYQTLLAQDPENVWAYNNLGNLALQDGALQTALDYYTQVLTRDPHHVVALNNMGQVLKNQGKLLEALAYFRRALKEPGIHLSVISNYLFSLHYDPHVTREYLFEESKRCGAMIEAAIRPIPDYNNSLEPERKLRIGLVSGDLRHHPVAFFIEPDLRHYDRDKLEIFVYANHAASNHDAVSDRLRSYVTAWRDIAPLSDAQTINLIRNDAIDILIDLSGHTGLARLAIFAAKPAPIQCTWIGYFNTTGLARIDYILTDKHLVPPEEEHLYVEKPLRLPENSAVFELPTYTIDPGTPPALKNGYVTFGSFNALAKITPDVLSLWAEILHAVPTAKLFIKNQSLDDAHTRTAFTEECKKLGIESTRLILEGFSNHEAYFEAYQRVDIALDPFPYNGGTTTIGTLWMGVPVVTLKGDRLIAHVGETILHHLGHPEWIAQNKQNYKEIATQLAQDSSLLHTTRQHLRHKLETSPLCDGPRHAKNLEATLRSAWREWCKQQKKY